MAVYTLMSPGSSPGVTTTALAVTHVWGGRTLLAECDPKGGNVLPGFLAGQMAGLRGGLLELALAIAHNPDPGVLWDHVISLDQHAREWLLLPGVRDPRHMAQLSGAWDAIAKVLTAATRGAMDVVLDVGQIGRPDTPMRLIAASDMAVMLLRPTLRQAAEAKPRLDALGRYVGTTVPVALCLVGKGDYTPAQISRALYGLPVIGTIPHDPRSAAVLSDGASARRPLRSSTLMRGASRLADAMRRRLTTTEDLGEAVAAG
ncbi:hypothetical protein GCM10010466_08650 [Planomonospora alba]|uniref:ParA family protein n=1 Tax=Planomonospora alba TaxID=161354 RepID=A0ABP6MN23_9ACTN